jgi:hypothetical protein
MPFPDEARSQLGRQPHERPAVQFGLPAGFVPSELPVRREVQSAATQHHQSQISASGRAAEAGHQVSGAGDFSEPMVSGPEGKRFIRLKEFRPCSTIVKAPLDSYIATHDSSLIRQPYKITTDQDGFILPRSGGRTHGRKIVVIGDSVVESMYSEPDHRFARG